MSMIRASFVFLVLVAALAVGLDLVRHPERTLTLMSWL